MKEPQGHIVSDPEIKALARIGTQMDGLSPEGRARVLNWLNARYRPGPEPAADNANGTLWTQRP